MLASELAKLLGRNATFINQVESAEIAIDTQTLEDCAAAFDISVVELLEMAISSPG
jgi:ribosome-binding protein aMBF1 (putative translation factor)